MSKSVTMLKWLLLMGAVYFLAVALAHMLRIKIPLLFVYFDVPSYGYQDRIISFLSFGWSVFLFTASRDPVKNRGAVKAILIAGLGAILGLTVINSHRFSRIVPGNQPISVSNGNPRNERLCGRLNLLLFFFDKTEREEQLVLL